MYGIFTNIYLINDPNVGKYTSTMDDLGKNILKSPVTQIAKASKARYEAVLSISAEQLVRGHGGSES